jgi:integrase
MAPRTRITIGPGMYQDPHGITVVARIGSGATLRTASARFPLVDHDGVPYSKKNATELLRCRLQLLEDLRTQRATDGTAPGTLGAAIDAWIADHPIPRGTRNSKTKDFVIGLRHWRRTPLAALPLPGVTRRGIRAQQDQWIADGKAPSTVYHRKRALAALLRLALGATDPGTGDDVPLPTDGVRKPPNRPREPRGILMPIVAAILAAVTPNRAQPVTRIRLTIMAWTGMSQISLIRLERRHVRFREAQIYLSPRHKGRGAKGKWVDLLPPALDALHAYDRLGLWGRPFPYHNMVDVWRAAIARVRRDLEREAETTGDRTRLEQFLISIPPNCRPYDLRHSFATDVYRQTKDIRVVKELLQHGKLETSEHYAEAAVSEVVAAGIEKMRAHWFPDAPAPGRPAALFHLVPKSRS